MNPIFSIWLKPLETFKSINERDEVPNDSMIALYFFLSSMASGLSHIPKINKFIGGEYYFVIIISLLVIGFVGLFLQYYLFSRIFWAFSILFQGKATINETRIIMAYSLIPNILMLIIGIVMFIPAILLDKISLISYQHPLTIFVIWIFTIRIFVIGLSLFNKFSYVYALLTIILPVGFLQLLSYLLSN